MGDKPKLGNFLRFVHQFFADLPLFYAIIRRRRCWEANLRLP
jgi:hypothetical protein